MTIRVRNLTELNNIIISCTRCPRLVEYRSSVASQKVKRYMNEHYWGRPLPGFGDPSARVLIVGLAPAAHGGNRTGRMFTGDSSGDFLFASLFRCRFSNQSSSLRVDDGLRLRGVYVTAALRCAPPENKPAREELERCFEYLRLELSLLKHVKVIVALGGIAFSTCKRLVGIREGKFRHGTEINGGGYLVVASYHPSRRNTQTGLLNAQMLDRIFLRAKALAGLSELY